MIAHINDKDLVGAFEYCLENEARIVLVVMFGDVYNKVKRSADSLQLSTQCLKAKNVERPPRGYYTNVLMKINAKMGGINHTLATRGRVESGSRGVFQNPPQSISWLLDELCMVVVSNVVAVKFYLILS
jgi:hypothetical protein